MEITKMVPKCFLESLMMSSQSYDAKILTDQIFKTALVDATSTECSA